MSVVSIGITPVAGDEVLVCAHCVYRYPGVRWLLVERVEPCPDPAWAWLTGRWVDDGSRGRVMAWLDRVLVRKAQLNRPGKHSAPNDATP